MKLTMYVVDAFTKKRFSGNPAAVCPLDSWLADQVMQSIARENNLSETAFFVRNGNKGHIRWFTPTKEIDLCGHATLASGFVAFTELGLEADQICFDSMSGPLSVQRTKHEVENRFVLDFPVRLPESHDIPPSILSALPAKPVSAFFARDLFIELPTEEAVREAAIDPALLLSLPGLGLVLTARGTNSDFVSRAFFPRIGIPEDPVTGSTHTTLAPFWGRELGKSVLSAEQVSSRGGELICTLAGDRVLIGGAAVLYARSEIYLDELV